MGSMEVGRERLGRWSLPALPTAFFLADVIGMIATTAGSADLPLGLGVPGLVLSGALSAGFLLRRRHPVPLFVVVVVATPSAATVSLASAAMVVCAAYAIGAWSRRVVLGSLAVAAVATLAGFGIGTEDGVLAGLGAAAFVGAPVAIGYAIRTRRLYVEEVERRLEFAELRREDRARQAVLAERNRIARELHDVVAHHVSLMGVRAGAARTALDRDPAQAAEALQAIEASSREAVAELHRLLGALRDEDDAADWGPQPGLGDLPELVDEFTAAGTDVHLDVDGDLDVDPVTGLTVYRLVEEALTNVTRHSAAESASVRVVVADDRVDLRVSDPGPSAATSRPGSGRGIVGMRERVLLVGGTIAVGPDDDGFGLDASVPRRRST